MQSFDTEGIRLNVNRFSFNQFVIRKMTIGVENKEFLTLSIMDNLSGDMLEVKVPEEFIKYMKEV